MQTPDKRMQGGERTFGALRVTPHAAGITLTFPPLRAAGSALMLAAFGAACIIIAAAAVAGLASAGGSSSLLALAFAGVLALPLAGLGLVFVAIALWTAANSLRVDISESGLNTQRRCFGIPLSQRRISRDQLVAIDARLAAKYVGVFGAVRYYCLFARTPHHAALIADSLKGPLMAQEIRNLIIMHLGMPERPIAGNEPTEIAASES
jgi:hypothetical protein